MPGIAIRSITHFLADTRHASMPTKRLFLNEREGTPSRFNETAHEPYTPITLRSLSTDRSLTTASVGSLRKGTASSARSPAKPRTERAPHFIKSLRSWCMCESVAQFRNTGVARSGEFQTAVPVSSTYEATELSWQLQYPCQRATHNHSSRLRWNVAGFEHHLILVHNRLDLT
jgi:hypothetical protein